MSVYKRDHYKTCPACKRSAIARTADGWQCATKRNGCSATFAAGTKEIESQADETWRYRCWVTLPNGSRVRVCGTPSINTKRAAEEAERAHVERTLNPPKVERERRRMSDVFKRFMADYVTIANNKGSEVASKQTAIDCWLEPALGRLYLDEVRAEHVADLTVKLHNSPKARGEGTLSTKSVKNVLQTLRKCLRWTVEMEWIDKAPLMKMPKVDEEEIRFLEREEQEALLAAVADDPLWRAAVLLALDAGLRQGELRALQWTDINGVTNRIVISRSRWRNEDTSTKSRKSRTVPLTPELRAALHAIRSTKLRGPYVLSRAKDGGAFGAEFMGETMDRLSRNAKLTDCGWHTLRHTFCTNLAMEAVPAKTIQKLAGHASLMTTMRYMHVVKGAEDDAIAALSAARARGGRATRDLGANESEAAELVAL